MGKTLSIAMKGRLHMELNIPRANRQVPASPHPLTEAEVQSSRSTHGDNRLSRRAGRGFWRQFLANLGDPVIRILLCALGLNLLFAFKGADWFETGGIALAVFLATLISTLSEYGSEASFARLSEACAQTVCRVRRAAGSGRDSLLEIPTEEVVVGDLVSLGAGEMIPADGVLLSGEVVVDQSAMTGEAKEVIKKPVKLDRLAGEAQEVVKKPVRPDSLSDKSGKAIQKPTEASHPSGGRPTQDPAPSPADPGALFRGCVILGGQGEMLVTRVGDKTFLGEISDEVQMDTRESPLKYRLNKLAGQISRMGYVAAALVALIFLLNAFLFDSGFDKSVIVAKLGDWRYVWNTLFHALTLGLTVLVVAVPEGLPMMIAVVLSSNIKKMVKDQVLVRKPVGIEAAGSMNLLFTDKTGTLTEGILSVGQVILGGGQMLPDMDSLHAKAPLLFTRLSDACMTNTQSKPGRKEEPPVGKDPGKSRVQESRPRALGGNATDRALMDAVLGNGSPRSPSPVVFTVPFDSSRKTSAALVRREDGQVLYVKGAPERLLPHVSGAYREDGQTIPLDKSAFTRKLDDLTRQGGRVLLLCERVLPRSGQRGALPPSRESLMQGQYGELTLVCAVLLADRIRKEAPEVVRKLRRAGIHVIMMTGDNRETARSIAERCDILGGGVNMVLESEELAHMTDNRIRELLPRIGVIARALPTDKSRLVRLSQEKDMVVGMTGDGINDAPALKRADIGFAMGAGTQVAKDAGDIIILDNNLSSISRAVLYGRTIFKSIRKFITLQLTMNLCAVGVSMICPFIGIDAPVTVVQMLWINLIMDTLGGLAFAGEAPLESYMKEKPKRRDEPILNRYMGHEIATLGCFTICLCLLFLKAPFVVSHFRTAPDNIYLLTAFFALFIFASVFNCFNARTDRLNIFAGLGKNRAFIGIMTAVLAIQILFVYLGGTVLRTSPLTLSELAFTSLLALTVFPVELIRKVLRRLRGHEGGY